MRSKQNKAQTVRALKRAQRWKSVQTRRASIVLANANVRKKHKPSVPSISKRKMLAAIKGSLGNKTEITRRLGCSYGTMLKYLNREGWEDIHEAYETEINEVGDLAEGTIVDAIKQRQDLSTAANTAKWLLTRARYKDRNMQDTSKLILEGGDKPLEMKSSTVTNVDDLDLSLDVRKAILLAMEEKDSVKAEDEVVDEDNKN